MSRVSAPLKQAGRRAPSGILSLPVAMFVVAGVVGPLFAGPPPAPPPFYAIRDARVEVGDGTVLERATVVIENGTITSVAADAAIPGHARVIDGEGLIVFPGLIDALGSLPRARQRGPAGPAAAGAGRRRPEPGQELPRGPEDRPLTEPWKRAADALEDMDADGVASWREAGFTSVVARPGQGLFPGRVSLVRYGVAGRDPEHQVLAPELAQMASLSGAGGFGSYPGALMGRIAYLRQLIFDASHYAEAVAAWETDPAGWRRPEFDRTLAPLAAVAAGRESLLLPGSSAVEIARALDLAEELGLHAVIYGGQEGYRLAAALAAAETPVLIDVDWPATLPERDRDPDADRPLREVLHERLAPTTPVEFAEAGIRFAFSSGGVNTPGEFMAGVRRAIEGGLPSRRALTALTRDAAAVFGVEDRVGTVAEGMAADLVLASTYPWQEDVQVDAVFIDGRRFAVSTGDAEDAESEAAGESAEAPSEDAEEDRTESERPGGARGSGRDFGRPGEDLDLPAPLRWSEIETRYAAAADEAGSVPMTGPYRDDEVLAITGGTVLTMAGETIPDGTIVVRDGRIEAVGGGIRPPPGAHVIDAAGGWVMPGIVDAHSHIATAGGVNEGSLAVTSMVRIADVVDPTDINIYRALAGGVTTVNVLHGSANPIGGQNQILKLRWGQDADGLRFTGAPAGIKFALGENPKRSRSFGPGPRRYPATRMGVLDVIRQAFTEARNYRQDLERHRAAEAAGERSRPPARDLRLEALVEVLDGTRLVHAHCYRADEILQLLRLAEELDFRIATLQHVLEGLPRGGRNRGPWGWRVDVLRLVGVQGGGLRGDPSQRGADDRPRCAGVHQLGRRRGDAPPEPRSGEGGQVGRPLG